MMLLNAIFAALVTATNLSDRAGAGVGETEFQHALSSKSSCPTLTWPETACSKNSVSGLQTYVTAFTPYTLEGCGIINVELTCNDGSKVWANENRNIVSNARCICRTKSLTQGSSDAPTLFKCVLDDHVLTFNKESDANDGFFVCVPRT